MYFQINFGASGDLDYALLSHFMFVSPSTGLVKVNLAAL